MGSPLFHILAEIFVNYFETEFLNINKPFFFQMSITFCLRNADDDIYLFTRFDRQIQMYQFVTFYH